jgi:hypothetical protein
VALRYAMVYSAPIMMNVLPTHVKKESVQLVITLKDPIVMISCAPPIHSVSQVNV